MRLDYLQSEVEKVWKGSVRYDCITGRIRSETDLVASFYRHICSELEDRLPPAKELEVSLDHGLEEVPNRSFFDVVIGERVGEDLTPGIVMEMKFDFGDIKPLQDDLDKLKSVQAAYRNTSRAYLCVTYTPDQCGKEELKVGSSDRNFLQVLVGVRPHRGDSRKPEFDHTASKETEWGIQQ